MQLVILPRVFFRRFNFSASFDLRLLHAVYPSPRAAFRESMPL